MRVGVYVDGFNVYYRALRAHPAYKWLNLHVLAQRLLDPADTIQVVRYFTARVKARGTDPDAPRRQQLYLSALATLPSATLHYGRFLPKKKWRPVVHPRWDPPVNIEVHDTEEKGSDVSLGVHLVNDAWTGGIEAALVLSQDTDLCEAIKVVAEGRRIPVGIVCLDGGAPNQRLARVASFVRHLSVADLAAAQFPDPVVGAHGKRIRKPESWI